MSRASTASTPPSCLYTSDADVVVSAGPTTANVARMLTYRPLPGQEAKTVTITMKILSRPSGEGTDYASMPVLASKDITLTVQPLTQEELDVVANAPEADFDRLWLEAMIAHHEGAVVMAEDQLADGVVPEVHELSREIIETQQAEIDHMNSMIETLG